MTERVTLGFSDDDIWVAGSTRRFTIPIVDAAGGLKSLTGASVVDFRMTDMSPLEGIPNVVMSKSLGSGTSLSPDDDHVVIVEIPAADSENLPPGDYYGEIWVVDRLGDRDSVTLLTARLTPSAFV